MPNPFEWAEDNSHQPAMPCCAYRGLTKREHLAGQMLAAMIASDDGMPMELRAKDAVSAAKLLLIELAKSEVAK